MTGSDRLQVARNGGVARDPALEFRADEALFPHFLRAVACNPRAPALITDDRVLSYSDLRAAAEGLAAELLCRNISPGDFVGLLATRSVDAIVGMLACARLGAGYVPLDPSHAPEQIPFICKDLPLKAVLVAPRLRDGAPGLISGELATVDLTARFSDAPKSPWPDIDSTAPAYVLYTSGTTGKPKGVVLSNKAVASMALRPVAFRLDGRDRILHASTLACDGSVVEIWGGLLQGAAVVVVEAETPSLDRIAEAMKTHEVTAASWYAGVHHLMIDHHLDAFATLRLSFSGGDVMSLRHAGRVLGAWPELALLNDYGPTETCVHSLAQQVTAGEIEGGEIPIGRALEGEEAFVVGPDLEPLAPGATGQLAIAGDGVAQGYFGRPDLTVARFIDDPRPGKSGRVYLTGDLACQREDGAFLFRGRADRQVKLNGHRIELDAVEHVLRGCAGVEDAIVELVEGPGTARRMVAFVVGTARGSDILTQAATHLSREVLPKQFHRRDGFPLTPAGKVDRKALADGLKPDGPAESTPRGDASDLIAAIWQDVLGGPAPQPDQTFFDLGGSSLQLIDAHARIEKALGRPVDIALMFDQPRLADLSARLAETGEEPISAGRNVLASREPVAIVGMAARLPRCDTLDDFWQVIREGRSVISHFGPGEMEDAVTPAERAAPNYVAARAILDDVDLFDAKFFGMLPAEAARTDPQQRVFLEVCQHALEDAGLDPRRFDGAIGVFAGASMSTYLLENLMADRNALRDFTSGFQIEDYATLTGNDGDSVATRIAFKLGLTGPAMAVNTACSTSLVAICQAVQALRSGQADAVLAGGVSITFPLKRGYFHQEGGMGSPDGECRPFDADAGGTVFGHGAGVVVLKRLSEAQAAGDRIYALIEGTGLNNDGADKMSYTAPSVAGQSAAIRMAQRDAGVEPSDIGYVETHGTATPLGDPIEISGLKTAFGGSDTPCALGSVKGNLGHLDAAAGVVSVIKTALAMSRAKIPPVAHFKTLNPRINMDGTGFHVPTAMQDWTGPRRAGVSSFGVGGTNAHIVMGAAPERAVAAAPFGPAILPLSAKSPETLGDLAQSLADHLEARADLSLPDVARSLQDGRSGFAFRGGVVAYDRAEAVAKLRALRPAKSKAADNPPLVFMFPGQGAQYPGMGSGLYKAAGTYRHWIDTGAEILRPLLGEDIAAYLKPGALDADQYAAALRETRLTQPALMLTQYATAKLWEARGITPDIMVGHSVGEFTAAALGGVMSFEAALGAIAARGQAMQDMRPGAMLSARAPLAELVPHLNGSGCDLAASNAPKLQVAAGPEAAIAELAAKLGALGIATTALHTSHAFHSRMMDPVVDRLEAVFAGIDLAAPDRPIVSAVTGKPLTGAEATSPRFWAAQARACVNFQTAVEAVAADKSAIYLEVGAGRTLSAFTTQTLDRGSHHGVFQSLPDHARSMRDEESMAVAATHLWAAGRALDWSRHSVRGATKVSLPGYPFQRKRHWIEPVERRAAPPHAAPAAPEFPATPVSNEPAMSIAPVQPRRERLSAELLACFADLSGEDLTPDDVAVPFLELGFDSLFLGQASQAIAKTYGVDLTFRRLLSDFPTIGDVAAHLDGVMPAETAPPPVPGPAPVTADQISSQPPVNANAAPIPAPADGVNALLQAQMQTMQAVFAQQLQVFGASGAVPATPQPAVAPAPPAARPAPGEKPASEGFKTGRGVSVTGGTMTPVQVAFARDLARRYSEKYPSSKTYAARHRKALADPRTAAGFRQEWKELVFPIVADRSKGAYIWDADGNRLVDLVNGFGQTGFGHSPDFVVRAVTAQMEKGFPIGPQADLAGPVAEKFARVVGHERVTFCNTGSEAVMAAMRLARTVTGREKIVVFDHDYHGQFDEVLVKGKSRPGGSPDALPIAPGIPRSGLANMVVLKYGDAASLDWVRDNIDEVAGVIVEPVQSRHPEHRPEDFVRKMRDITREGGAALVIDEVVTGFRTGKRGMQGVWGLQADMATYGKVVGGGMPIGILAGDAKWMDALDGGHWDFGDDSRPEAIPTFFAGTFVRHPLVLAAVDATLDHMEVHGDRLWTGMAEKTGALAKRMSKAMTDRGLPDLVETYSSWFVINLSEHDPRASLLYPLMRLEGVHVMDSFCGFLTTEHTDADIEAVFDAFVTALDALLSVGIMGELQDKSKIAVAPEPALAPARIPLTESQREIWMSHQMGGDAAASFNELGVLRLKGRLDADALQAALDGVMARHDALRARFLPDGSGFEVTEPRGMAMDRMTGDAAALDLLIAETGRTPFDLTAEPPVRAVLMALGPDDHALMLAAHHIVADGWSFGVILDDLAELYTARVENREAVLDPAPSFADFARARPAPRAETRAFWRKVYADLPEAVDLPTDHPRPARKTYAGATQVHHVDAETLNAIRKLGAAHGCTLFATLFAATQALIARLSGATDVVLGVPTAAQADLENTSLVGHCVNFLPVRAPFATGASVADHLGRVKTDVLGAFDHQDYTFGTLLRDLDVPRAIDRLPLTNVEFNLERDTPLDGLPGLKARFLPSPKTAVNFDLFLNMCEGAGGLRIDAHFNADLFKRETVAGWLAAFDRVLAEMLRDPAQPVTRLALGKVAAPVAVAGDYDRSAMIHDLIAPAGPRIAIEDGADEIDYATLHARSDAIAALIQRSVPGRGARVALYLPRGHDMVAALLGVLKTGHAYVPLDPRQPEARLRQICQTARVAAVIGDADLGAPRIDLADAVDGARPNKVTRDPESTAYVIFTSGSTGMPKGVEIPHRAVVNFLTSMAREPGLSPDDVLLSVTTVMFDIAVLELLLPLTQGAKLVVTPTEAIIDGFKLVERLNRGDITVMQATPTLWDMLLMAGLKPAAGLKMLAGGEPLPRDLADRLLAGGGALWNMYGPTETTIWSTCARVEAGAPIHVGGPIANTGLHVLDKDRQPVPSGVAGQLHISGDGLARGYFDRSDLTEAAFFEHDGTRFYATGDLAKWLPEGHLQVLGRIDTQIKLRGFRIEPGEIETRLRAEPGIAKAAVALHTRPGGDKQLVAYLVPDRDVGPDTAGLAEALRTGLPDYMVPQAWVVLSDLPQTANGKLDRKALPTPDASAEVTALRPAAPPETPTETRIAEIWRDVLGLGEISATETLFALGVDSLAVFRIAAKMLDAGLGLEARHMLAHPTIRELAAFHDTRGDAGPAPDRPSLKAYRGGARRRMGGAA